MSVRRYCQNQLDLDLGLVCEDVENLVCCVHQLEDIIVMVNKVVVMRAISQCMGDRWGILFGFKSSSSDNYILTRYCYFLTRTLFIWFNSWDEWFDINCFNWDWYEWVVSSTDFWALTIINSRDCNSESQLI